MPPQRPLRSVCSTASASAAKPGASSTMTGKALCIIYYKFARINQAVRMSTAMAVRSRGGGAWFVASTCIGRPMRSGHGRGRRLPQASP